MERQSFNEWVAKRGEPVSELAQPGDGQVDALMAQMMPVLRRMTAVKIDPQVMRVMTRAMAQGDFDQTHLPQFIAACVNLLSGRRSRNFAGGSTSTSMFKRAATSQLGQ